MANNYQAWIRDGDIPNDPDKQIFGVDVVYFVMINRWPDLNGVLPREIDGSEEYRDRVYPAYTGVIREAIEHLASEFADDIQNRFSAFLQNNPEINEESFQSQRKELVQELSADGFLNCRAVLRYSACISLLAGHYYNHGVTEARRLATNLVHCALPAQPNENSDYWDKLAAAAEKLLDREEPQRPADPPNLNAAEYQEHPSPRNIPGEPF